MKIKVIKNVNPTTVRLIFYDNTSYQVTLDSLLKFDLFIDKEISESDLGEIRKFESQKKFIANVIDLVNIRPRSKNEIELYLDNKLKQISDAKEIILSIIKYLETKGYIDDANFAKWWIGNRNAFKPKSRQELIFELKGKGIDKAIIEDVLNNEYDNDLAAGHIKQMLINKFKLESLEGLDIKQKQKIISYFLRKGYNYELIRSVIDNL